MKISNAKDYARYIVPVKAYILMYLVHLVGISNYLDWAASKAINKDKNAWQRLLNQTPVKTLSFSLSNSLTAYK